MKNNYVRIKYWDGKFSRSIFNGFIIDHNSSAVLCCSSEDRRIRLYAHCELFNEDTDTRHRT